MEKALLRIVISLHSPMCSDQLPSHLASTVAPSVWTLVAPGGVLCGPAFLFAPCVGVRQRGLEMCSRAPHTHLPASVDAGQVRHESQSRAGAVLFGYTLAV